jgi:hypothetical protein
MFLLPVIFLIISFIGYIMVNLKGNYENIWGYMAIWGFSLMAVSLFAAILSLIVPVYVAYIICVAICLLIASLLSNA